MKISRTFKFEAAHRLTEVPCTHKCSELHGHSFRVTVVVDGPLQREGWVIDFAEISAAWQPIHEMLDHHTLNNVAGLENPSSENLAIWIFRRLRESLPLLVEVIVSETEWSSATCTLVDAGG